MRNESFVQTRSYDKVAMEYRFPAKERIEYMVAWFRIFLCLSCLMAFSKAASSEVVDADVFFDATLYFEAIPLYQERLKDSQPKLADHLRLAQACYFTKQYEEAASQLRIFLKASAQSGDALHFEALYWLGLTCKQLGLQDEAVHSLKQYCTVKNKADRPHYEEACVELGLACVSSGALAEAREIFSAQPPNPACLHLFAIARLNLAKIELLEGKDRSAEIILKEIAPLISHEDPLSSELEFLYAEVLFKQGNFLQAAEKFETCLSNSKPGSPAWHLEAWYRLGNCYMKAANEPDLEEQKRKTYYTKSELAFQSLLKISPSEEGVLSLGECLAAQAKIFKEPHLYAKVEEVLSNEACISSRIGQAKALLLRAEAVPDHAKKSHLYALLTSTGNSDLYLYPSCWYLRGMNNYEQGLALKAISKSEEAAHAFDLAIKAFQKAFSLFISDEPQKAGKALLYQVHSKKEIHTPESLTDGLKILDLFFTDYPEVFAQMQEPGEALYLHGSLASALSELGEKERYLEIAARSLQRSAKDYPKGQYAGESLLLLGSLYWRNSQYAEAEQVFTQLAETYPSAPQSSEALYWAAECMGKLCKDPEKVRQLRLKNGRLYPQSPFAAEAYFKAYSFIEYLQGDRAAIKHIQMMKELFPKSPFVINAHYLSGLDLKRDRKSPEGKWIRRKNLVEAIEVFHSAELAFEHLLKEELIPQGQLDYFIAVYYKAKIERAMANLVIAGESQGAKRQIYLEYSEDLLTGIRHDFERPEHVLTKHLARKDAYPPILEEASYRLAQTYIKGDNEFAADQVLTKMLEKYRSAKITRGYFFARSWYQRALIAMRKKEFVEALQYLANAEEGAKGKVLNTDQRLDLWIQQSICYRECNEIDKAMLILSKIINDDAISGRRLQAMYLRAELYKIQGRQELARKQLEATSKKGGEWGQKAKEALSNSSR
jgi:tetratricopeptide (TPR) repeat protein